MKKISKNKEHVYKNERKKERDRNVLYILYNGEFEKRLREYNYRFL